MANFDGKVAIVTGAGSGIGSAIARLLAGSGARVLVNDIDQQRAERTAEVIRSAGGQARAFSADVSDETAAAAMAAEVVEVWGRIDVLCNNAGIMDRMETAEQLSLAQWNRLIAINVTGPFLLTRAVLPKMIAQRSGAIVNTASMASLRGGAAGLAYTVSKHAIAGFTKNIAWMHAEQGIRCNAICPGPVDTDIAGGKGVEQYDPTNMQRIAPVFALAPRVASPEETANVVVFLASDDAAQVNGVIMPVDAGWAAA